jgi:vacuolar-type H+-ATPase subunit I/STV1
MAGAGLRRRSRLVTFLGASLVFARFVCKEVLLEHQKSIVEQADSAQRTFVILKRLDLLTARVTAIEAATDAARIHQRDLALMIRLSRASSDIKAYAESFEGLISEVKKAPIDRDRAKRIVTQAQQMDSDLDELNHAARRSDETANNWRNRANALLNRQLRFEHLVREFSTKLLERLRDEKQQAERKQRHITNWSYVLYVAGFLFGLFGQLLGVANTRSE